MEQRPTLICSVLLFVLLQLSSTDAYSKYGRSCSDIGCLSSETCVMVEDSCSYSQRENKDCGKYPTCKKTGAAGSSPGAALNPSPQNTRTNYNPNFNTNANQNPSSAPQNPYPNVYPQLPTGNAQYPQYPGQYPGQQPPPFGQQPYGQQPYPNQPPYGQQPNYPYGGQNPNPYGNQNPYGNGQNFPSFPNYRNIPTTTEPSLWHQFLNNKGGRNYYGNAGVKETASKFTILLTGLFVVVQLLRH